MSIEDFRPDLSDVDQGIESALSRLIPAPAHITPREVFLGSQLRRAGRRMRLYRAAAAILGLGLAVSLVARTRPMVHETPPYVQTGVPPESSSNTVLAPPPVISEQFRLCQEIAENGLSALPAPPPSAPSPNSPQLSLDPGLLQN